METQIKMNYKREKLMKKAFGKLQGAQIALGRNLIKMIEKQYQPERLSEKTIRNDGSDSLNSMET